MLCHLQERCGSSAALQVKMQGGPTHGTALESGGAHGAYGYLLLPVPGPSTPAATDSSQRGQGTGGHRSVSRDGAVGRIREERGRERERRVGNGQGRQPRTLGRQQGGPIAPFWTDPRTVRGGSQNVGEG